MKTILIIGDDKLGRKAIATLGNDTQIYLNRSNSIKRILKLLSKNILSINDLLVMSWAEFWRHDTQISYLPILTNNQDVANMIKQEKPDRVICFRAGLIIASNTLDSGPQFLNLHYADLPQWGGLGSLPRALRAKSYDQNACLHIMVSEIDKGDVLARQYYRLDPNKSYRENEDLGFSAGLTLLEKIINND